MTQKSSKQKQSQNIQEQLMTLQKQQTSKKQNESNKQFFTNAIKGQQENEREERERNRESFFKLRKAMVSNNIGN